MNFATLLRYQDLGIENGVWNQRHYILNKFELMAIENGVGLCAIISPFNFEDICARCDGLIIPGSRNRVNPSYFGREPMDPPPAHDDFALDIKIIDYFIKNNKPVLGICAGLQALNIYFGGTIARISNGVCHSDVTHNINIKPGTFVADAFGSESAVVNSHHVMHIDNLAKELEVAATSDDGIIEAVQNKERRIFATQWHPERSYHTGNTFEKNIFKNFIECCRK